MKLLLSISLTIFIVNVFACDPMGLTGFAPQNTLYIPSYVKNTGIDEATFNKVIDEVEAIYAPIIANNNRKLKVNRKWEDGTVNASAQRMGKSVVVNMYGGLARHKAATQDGFAIVLCHELGHHLGGFPQRKFLFFPTWASNEGQSDYFATLKCFRKVYENENNMAYIKTLNVPSTVKTQCDQVYADVNDSALCQRMAMASLSTSTLLASLRGNNAPEFDAKDQSVVRRTSHSHPKAQCRLDTYFAGALCDIDHTVDVHKKDPTIGTCNRKNGDTIGLRSLCWYKPKK